MYDRWTSQSFREDCWSKQPSEVLCLSKTHRQKRCTFCLRANKWTRLLSYGVKANKEEGDMELEMAAKAVLGQCEKPNVKRINK